MVERYEPSFDERAMVTTGGGAWVYHPDYATLEAENTRLRALIDAAPCPKMHPDQGGPCCPPRACDTAAGCDCWKAGL